MLLATLASNCNVRRLCLPAFESQDFFASLETFFGTLIKKFSYLFASSEMWICVEPGIAQEGGGVMIENYRSGLMWKYFMANPEIQPGAGRDRLHARRPRQRALMEVNWTCDYAGPVYTCDPFAVCADRRVSKLNSAGTTEDDAE